MKKLVMAAAVVGAFAGTAQAQTSVTLYGIADGDLRLDHTNIGTLKSVGSGGESGSRWGIRGSEDLGGGLKANFIFEQGFQLDDNSVAQGNVGASGSATGLGGSSTAPHGSTGSRVFSRVSTVSLSGGFGEIRFGHGYTPLFLVQATADPYGAGMVGMVSNIYVNNTVRNDNAVFYDTPSFYGVQLSGVYQLGESTTNTPVGNSATPPAAGQVLRGNDHYGAGLNYASGPIYAGIGYEEIKSNLNIYNQRTVDAAVTYDFGFLKLHALYWHTANHNPALTAITQRERAANIGVTVPFGAWTLLAQYGDLRDTSSYNSGLAYGTPRVHFPSAGFRYSLSKRTIIYGSYARMDLKAGAQGQAYSGYGGISDASNAGLYNGGNLANALGQPNVNPYSAQVGIRHSF